MRPYQDRRINGCEAWGWLRQSERNGQGRTQAKSDPRIPRVSDGSFVPRALFGGFSTYRMLLQGRFREGSFEYGTALINALILSKIVLIGEYLRLGKRQENRPLIYSTVYKSLVFTLLVAMFHVLEEAIRGLLHGEGLRGAFAALRDRSIAEVLAAGVVYC